MTYPASRPKAMNDTHLSLTPLLILFCAAPLAGTGFAQEQIEATVEGGKPKFAGTYLSATGMMPPLPYHPYPDLPTVAVGKNQFAYDDSKVDYATLRAESAKQARANREARFQEEAEGGGPGSPLRQFMEEDLRLVPKQITNNTLLLTIAGNDPALPYDLYSRTNIAGTNAWTYLGRQSAGMTNIAVPLQTNGAMFFQLGTTYDGDGD